MLVMQQTAAFLYQTQAYVAGMGGLLSESDIKVVASHTAFIISKYLGTRGLNGVLYTQEIYSIVISDNFANYNKQELSVIVEKMFNK